MNDIETAGTIEVLLSENDVNSFPVVNRVTKEYVGLIRRYVDSTSNLERSKLDCFSWLRANWSRMVGINWSLC